jgi:hypothetical protein
LTPQEQAFYQRHLDNLTGFGGVDNQDGSRSTVRQLGVGIGGRTYWIPSVWGGQILEPRAAIRRAEQEGFQNFPSYASDAEADARYRQLHGYMDKDTAAYFQARNGARNRLLGP